MHTYLSTSLGDSHAELLSCPLVGLRLKLVRGLLKGGYQICSEFLSSTYASKQHRSKALFSSKNFCKIGIVPLLFVFDKYYPIMY